MALWAGRSGKVVGAGCAGKILGAGQAGTVLRVALWADRAIAVRGTAVRSAVAGGAVSTVVGSAVAGREGKGVAGEAGEVDTDAQLVEGA
jgi:hypothetical protein